MQMNDVPSAGLLVISCVGKPSKEKSEISFSVTFPSFKKILCVDLSLQVHPPWEKGKLKNL